MIKLLIIQRLKQCPQMIAPIMPKTTYIIPQIGSSKMYNNPNMPPIMLAIKPTKNLIYHHMPWSIFDFFQT